MEMDRAWMNPLKLRIPLQALVFLLAVFSTGCKESPCYVKEGAPFAAPEKASPGKALAYVYWPREEQGEQDHLWVEPCDGGLGKEILPGGYVALDIAPGPGCLKVQADVGALDGNRMFASLHRNLGNVELNAEPGRTLFVRLEQKRQSLIFPIDLRPVEAAVAGPEIRRCLQTIPLTPEELDPKFLQEMEKRG